MDVKNIFIEGCSGSGKDTLSNYFRDNHNYFKIRIADTIKRIICEKENLTFDELEEQKRINPELRLLHNKVGKYLDEKNGTFNRINQIINRTALDFQHEKDIENLKVCVCDARGYENAKQLLEAGFIGFFLLRDNNEFGDSNHWTEKTLGRDKRIIELAKTYYKQMVIIFNFNRLPYITEIDDYRKNFIENNNRFVPILLRLDGRDSRSFIEDFNQNIKILSNTIFTNNHNNIKIRWANEILKEY